MTRGVICEAAHHGAIEPSSLQYRALSQRSGTIRRAPHGKMDSCDSGIALALADAKPGKSGKFAKSSAPCASTTLEVTFRAFLSRGGVDCGPLRVACPAELLGPSSVSLTMLIDAFNTGFIHKLHHRRVERVEVTASHGIDAMDKCILL